MLVGLVIGSKSEIIINITGLLYWRSAVRGIAYGTLIRMGLLTGLLVWPEDILLKLGV